MTIKKVKDILDPHDFHYFERRRNSVASAYFSAAMIALLLAAVILLLGIALIDYEVGSYFEEKPMINIVLPSDV